MTPRGGGGGVKGRGGGGLGQRGWTVGCDLAEWKRENQAELGEREGHMEAGRVESWLRVILRDAMLSYYTILSFFLLTEIFC